MCIDHNYNDLYKCEREEIPLEGVREARVLHSSAQVKIIQRVIKEGLTMWQRDMDEWAVKDPKENYWESKDEGCVDKCCELKYMYSNVIAIMVTRMLKLLLWVLKHRLTLEQDLITKFN